MHVAITGASSGIGEALARAYQRRGARLTLVARREELLRKLAGELGGAHVAVQDLADVDRSTAWIAAAEAVHGPIDVLVNNAGAENVGPALRVDVANAERMLRVNLGSPLRLAHAVAPGMVARGSGAIVQVCSVAALAAPPYQSWYAASKAGLAAFSEALRSELRGTGVHVLTVYPGPVTTELGERGYARVGGRVGPAAWLPEGKPDVLAERIVGAVDGRRARVIYPRFYALSRWSPPLSRWVTDTLATVQKRYLPDGA